MQRLVAPELPFPAEPRNQLRPPDLEPQNVESRTGKSCFPIERRTFSIDRAQGSDWRVLSIAPPDSTATPRRSLGPSRLGSFLMVACTQRTRLTGRPRPARRKTV